jgi:hypothetical protein
MSLSSCEKCWDSNCLCGYKYRNDSLEYRINRAAAILGVPVHAIEETLSGIIPQNHPLKGK